MDSFELTKIAGGVLAALLLIFLPKVLLEEMRRGGEVTGGFVLPEAAPTTAATSDGAPAAAPEFDPEQVVAALPSANPENAKGTFRKCLACHSAEKDAASKAGPNLWGVLGREHAAVPDFKGYSDVLKGKPGAWTYSDLAAFLHSPKSWAPGTRMVFAGVSDPEELADLVAYLRTLSDSPLPLPEAAPATPEAAPSAPEGGPSAKSEGAPAQPEAPAGQPEPAQP